MEGLGLSSLQRSAMTLGRKAITRFCTEDPDGTEGVNPEMTAKASMQKNESRLCSVFLGASLVWVIVLLAGCNAAKIASTVTPSTNPSPTPVGTLSASNTSLDFGSVAMGSSKTMPLTLTNGGSQNATVQVSQINVSGPAFKTSGVTPPVTLSAGQSIVVNVGFHPSAGGAATGSISIVSTASDPTVSVSLSGTGLAAGNLAVNPASMTFGSVTVGASQSQAGTLTAGSSSVTVSSASWNGTGFSLSGISFPVTVAAGQSVPFTVAFVPQASGSASGTVSFLSNATNSPATEAWSGTGVQQATPHSVALNWNTDPTAVQGYYVYRGAQSGGPYNKISALQPTNTYTDTTVASAQTYFYVVTAVGTNAAESGFSNEAVATIP